MILDDFGWEGPTPSVSPVAVGTDDTFRRPGLRPAAHVL